MSKDPSELLEFPCHYQFKAVGVSGDDFHQKIISAVQKHVSVGSDNIKRRPSSNGNYQSITIFVTLHNYEQLTAIYQGMKTVSGLKMLL